MAEVFFNEPNIWIFFLFLAVSFTDILFSASVDCLTEGS